jgi:hypothetical protein
MNAFSNMDLFWPGDAADTTVTNVRGSKINIVHKTEIVNKSNDFRRPKSMKIVRGLLGSLVYKSEWPRWIEGDCEAFALITRSQIPLTAVFLNGRCQ